MPVSTRSASTSPATTAGGCRAVSTSYASRLWRERSRRVSRPCREAARASSMSRPTEWTELLAGGMTDMTPHPSNGFLIKKVHSARASMIATIPLALLLATTCPGSAAAAADPLFGPKTDIATWAYPSCVVIGDLNGDGKPDLVVAHSGGTISVLLGNGDG